MASALICTSSDYTAQMDATLITSMQSAYRKLQERYNNLQQLVFVDNETDSKTSYVYVQPYRMADFLSYFSTSINLEVTSNNKIVGKCVIAKMDKVISISKSTQKLLSADFESLEPGQSIESEKLKNCYVTLCRSKGKNFWLITAFEPKRSKCLSIQNAHINVDEILKIWEEKGLKEAIKVFHLGVNGFGYSVSSQKKSSSPSLHPVFWEDVPLLDEEIKDVNIKEIEREYKENVLRQSSPII